MQSENFDKKIRDSLSQRPPGNDNPEWDKMEVLLDKHLPTEKKDKRRFFFIFLFLFLLTGGGAFLIWQKNNGDKNKISEIGSQSSKIGTPTNTNSNPTNGSSDINTNTITKEKETNELKDETNSVLNKITTSKDPIARNDDPNAPEFIVSDPAVIKRTKDKNVNKPVVENTNPIEKTERKIAENNVTDKNQKETKEFIKTEPTPISTEKTEVDKEKEPQRSIAGNKIEGQKTETKEPQPVPAKRSNSQKNKSSFLNNLFFSVSAGPDYSSVNFNRKGKIELAYGAGIGYRISNKLSLRTGFYSARKVYTAYPEDYYLPPNIAQYYPNLKNIEANCKVYEIPVMLDYTISSNKKQSWFVSAGASTLLMKEEKYDYYYRPNYSPTYVKYTRTIKNENKHYFSQLNIAGGYTRNINKNISFRAEPYMKIALDGIGFGKVNLNSGGLLFSAIIKPFAKK